MDGRPIWASKYAANGAKNTGSSSSASTRPNSTGSTSNSGGRIESHNVGWSFTVLSTMASIPSSQGVEAIFSPINNNVRDRHALTFSGRSSYSYSQGQRLSV